MIISNCLCPEPIFWYIDYNDSFAKACFLLETASRVSNLAQGLQILVSDADVQVLLISLQNVLYLSSTLIFERKL